MTLKGKLRSDFKKNHLPIKIKKAFISESLCSEDES